MPNSSQTEAPLQRLTFDAAALMREHPPIWRHPNKLEVFKIACPANGEHQGQLVYSRWPARTLPEESVTYSQVRIEARPDVFDYQPVLRNQAGLEWHLNFADPHLFVAYGSRLFAQDEMQVTEHPALGALLEALHARNLPALTVENSRPTPVLVRGVERRCAVATNPDPTQGRPHGLYGNHFGAATAEAVRRATRPIIPPTQTNLICLASLPGGFGRYRPEEIHYLVTTAFTGFSAAVSETSQVLGPGATTVILTGYWGCGAFGGNRILMSLLQILAASLAGAGSLVFHTVAPNGLGIIKEAEVLSVRLASRSGNAETRLIKQIAAENFLWGTSDGN